MWPWQFETSYSAGQLAGLPMTSAPGPMLGVLVAKRSRVRQPGLDT